MEGDRNQDGILFIDEGAGYKAEARDVIVVKEK